MTLLACEFADVGGRKVRFSRMGHGWPVILTHGYPDNLQQWSDVAPILARSFEVIAFDWPGMGQSDAWPGGATPLDMAARLKRLLDHWEIERAAVVGLDMGGQAALAAAALFPDRISHLVVSGSLVQWDAPTSWEIGLLRRFGFNRLVLSRFPRLVFHRAVHSSLPRGFPLDLAVRDDFWRSFRTRRVRDFVIRMCAGYQGTLPRLAEHYGKIETPVLILWAEGDRHFPPIHARRLGEQLRNATTVTLLGDHWLPLEQPQRFAAEMESFLRKQLLAISC